MFSVAQQAVQESLTDVLADASFRRAPKMARLLEYLVAKELRNEGADLTGYRVGVEALGKPADFNPSEDAGVRVEVGRLRRMLDCYYAAVSDARVVISVPKGGYQPHFESNIPDEKPLITSTVSAGPAVAVLNFGVQAEDAESSVFALALREELLVELFRYREIHVVDGSGVNHEDSNANRDCRELECEYILRGAVQVGSNINVLLSMVDLGTNRVVWSFRKALRAEDQDLFTLAYELAAEAAQKIAPPVANLALDSFAKRLGDVGTVTASTCLMKWHLYRLRNRTLAAHRELSEELRPFVERDPFFALGITIQAMLELDLVIYHGAADDVPETLQRATFLAQQAVSIDPEFATAHFVLAQCHYFRDEPAAFEAEARQALALHQRNIDLTHHIGAFFYLSGNRDVGNHLLDRAGLEYHAAIGYRMAHLIRAYDQADWERAENMLGTTYLPDGFVLGQLLAAILRYRTGTPESRRQTQIPPLPLKKAQRYVELWIKDDALKSRLLDDLNTLLN